MSDCIIIGGFHEIIELAEELNYKIIGLVDNNKTGVYYNYPVLGSDNDIRELYNLYNKIPLIITPDRPLVRKVLYLKYQEQGFSFKSLISQNTKISKTATISIGSIIQSGVNISSETVIGKFAKLNTKCNIMHNVLIGDFTTIAPNAVVLGNVKIGHSCYIGANSTILPHLTICDGTIIGAGSVVTKDILQAGSYVGIPARQLHL